MAKSVVITPQQMVAKMLINHVTAHAFVTSKLDYSNSLLYNQPKYILKRLQSVQICAAKLIHMSNMTM